MEKTMPAIKVGVREFREQISMYLESKTPVAVTRRGETLGVYVPTPRKHIKPADLSELRAAADRLAATLASTCNKGNGRPGMGGGAPGSGGSSLPCTSPRHPAHSK